MSRHDRTRFLVRFGPPSLGSLTVSIPVHHNKYDKPINVMALAVGLALKKNQEGCFRSDGKPIVNATELQVSLDLVNEDPAHVERTT